MLSTLLAVALVVVSGAMVVRIVVFDEPRAITPPRQAPPQQRASTNRAPARSDRPWWRYEGRHFVEIFGLAGFAVAQPVLGSFGRSPETFVSANASAAAIVGFALAVVLVPPLAVWAVAAATRLVSARVRKQAQATAIGLLVVLFISWVTRPLFSSWGLALLAAGTAGVTAALAYQRSTAARLYLRFTAGAPLAFLAIFLGFSPATNLVFVPEDSGRAVAASNATSPPPSVVVVVLDELPTMSLLDGRNRIDPQLFPNFARFADDATFYRNNTTVATFTVVAMPGLLTGRVPTEAAAVRDDYVANLFTLLADTHDLNVHEPLTSLCPPSLCDETFESGAIGRLGSLAWGLWTSIVTSSTEQSIGEDDAEALERSHRDFWAALDPMIANRDDQVDRFVDSLQPAGARPRLDFGHLLFPHVPWDRLPSGHRYEGDANPLGLRFPQWTTPTAAQLGRQRHLLQLQYTDVQLGRVLDRLHELDRYDDSYVIVLADHGVSFGDQEVWRGVSPENAHELLWVPLLIKGPGQADGRFTDVNSQTIDLLPTIADAMGIDLEWEVDGRSLLTGPPRPAGEKRFVPDVNQGSLEPDPGESYATIDGVEGFANMLAAPPASAVPSDDRLALYRLAPHVDLTGRSVDELRHGPPADWTVRLVDAEQYEEVDLGAETLPVYVSGIVDDPPIEPRDLVVAVNGVIGGWGRLEAGRGPEERRFAVLVFERLLRWGTNTVEVFAMEGPPGDITLRPVELAR